MALVLTLFFLFLAARPSAAEDVLTCTTERLQYKEVRYPFGFDGDKVRKGFKLTCNQFSQVVLQVPNAGDFLVKRIDYAAMSIIIIGCVSQSSFSNIHPFFTNLTKVAYFNCPSKFSTTAFYARNIGCLSNENKTVVAIADIEAAQFQRRVSSCKKQPSTYEVPTYWFNSSNDEAALYWNSEAPTEKGKGLSRWKRIVSMILLILYGAFCFSCCWCCWNDRGGGESAPDAVAGPCRGLDAKTMETYPSLELGESMRIPNSNETTCPVCLADFKPKDIIKTIHCGHIFHVECIDQWLRRRATCPVCRKLPDD